MKTVLCTLDFSESSLKVMKAAFEMAAQFHTNVMILFSYRLVQPSTGAITEYRKEMETRSRQDFENLLKKVNIDSVKYEFRSEIGFLSDRLEVYGQQNKVGMIVMGQDMASSINEHKGLSLQDFIKSLKIPMLIVPKELN